MKKNLLVSLFLAVAVAAAAADAAEETVAPMSKSAAVSLSGSSSSDVARKDKRGRHVIDDDDFNLLCSFIDDAHFDDEAIVLLRVAVMGCDFTAEQTAKILSYFDFDDDKLEALSVMAHRVVGRRGIGALLEQFDFSSSKEAAIKMLDGN